MPKAYTKPDTKASRRTQILVASQHRSPRTWICIAVVVAAMYLGFQVYAPAFRGPFVFDDLTLPYSSPDSHPGLLPWLGVVRPVLIGTYWLNYRISKELLGFHLVNVFLHVINSLLVCLIVRKLLQRTSPALPDSVEKANLLAGFAAAVFLLHPIQTEAVSYIAGRSECLSVLFFFAAFAVFLYRRQTAVTWNTALAVLLLFGAAVITKEHTLVLPGLLLLTDYFWNPGFSLSGIRRNWRMYAPIAAVVVAGAALLARVLAQTRSAGFGLKDFTWYQYFFTECRAFFVYLRLLFFPVGQNLDWDFPVSRTIMDRGAIFALIALLILVGAAIYFRRRFPLMAYGFLVFLLLMLPTSSIMPIKDPLAERRLYLPMIGMLLLVIAVLQRVNIDRRRLTAGAACVIVSLGVLTYQRNRLWASDIGLLEDTAAKSPAKPRAHLQLAFIYYVHGRCQEAAVQYAEAARQVKPDHDTLVDWGLACECAGQADEAVARLREAVVLKRTAHVFSQIGMVYARHSRWTEALEALAEAGKLDPGYAMTYYYRGGVRANTQDLAGAVADYQLAVKLNPQSQPARQALAWAEQQLDLHR